MNNYGYPTTRCFPRSLQDAFKDADYAEWWRPHETTTQDRIVSWTGVALWVSLAIYFWRTWA